jgi:hypothetical protein
MQLALRLQIEVHPDAAELRPRLGLRRPIGSHQRLVRVPV